MEFLLISESKLKIVMRAEEVEKYEINTTGEIGSPGLRRSFWRVLDIAKGEVGFDPKGDKILIQLYPIKDGGCEIFVTKLGILPESSARMVSKSDRVGMLSKKISFYAFESLDDMISAAKAVKNLLGNTKSKSDVYLMGNQYYLSVEEYGKSGESVEFPCILEFGRSLTADFWIYASEHATRLTNGDGIDLLSSM